MLIDDGLLRRDAGHWTVAEGLTELPVPPTIHALLGARLEALPDHERALLAHASVEGTEFHRGALDALAPESLAPDVERGLTALVRRDLIRPDRSTFVDDDTFRFRHILIRDAAYRSLPKERRAVLHRRFAEWLEQTAASRLGAFEEIAGYHLEQAYVLLGELGTPDAEGEALAARAARHLETAGRRALARSDHTGAVSLLERAAALLPDDHPLRAMLFADLGAALIEAGRLAEADDVLWRRGRHGGGRWRMSAPAPTSSSSDSSCDCGAVNPPARRRRRRSSTRVIPVFQRADDEYGLCDALRLRAWLHWTEAHADAAAEAWERAAAHARRAGAEHERIEILGWVASSLWWGPTPVAEALRRCEAIRSEVSGSLTAAAHVLQPLAGLYAMEGRFDRARELQADSIGAFEELGLTLSFAVSHTAAIVDLLAGDPVGAERSLRRGWKAFEEMGYKEELASTAALLAQALLAQRRDEEAERFAELSEELAPADELIAQVMWRGVRARTLAGRGRDGGSGAARARGRCACEQERLRERQGRRDVRSRGRPSAGRAAGRCAGRLHRGVGTLRAEGERGRFGACPGGACRACVSLRRSRHGLQTELRSHSPASGSDQAPVATGRRRRAPLETTRACAGCMSGSSRTARKRTPRSNVTWAAAADGESPEGDPAAAMGRRRPRITTSGRSRPR